MNRLFPVIVDAGTNIQLFSQNDLPCPMTAAFERGHSTNQIYKPISLTLHYAVPLTWSIRTEGQITDLVKSSLSACPAEDRDNLRRTFGDILDTLCGRNGGYWSIGLGHVADVGAFSRRPNYEKTKTGAFAFHATPDFVCLTGTPGWTWATRNDTRPNIDISSVDGLPYYQFQSVEAAKAGTLFELEFFDRLGAFDDDQIVVISPAAMWDMSNHEVMSYPMRVAEQLPRIIRTFPGEPQDLDIQTVTIATDADKRK